MGSYTPLGLYKPNVGEVGWGVVVDDNFDIIDAGLGGPGGGGTANLIDVTESPYSADPTGDTFADTAIQNAFDAAFAIGPGSGVWLPGEFKVKTNLAHFEVNGITVEMPPGAKLVIGDDMGGDSLFSCLARKGPGFFDSLDDTVFRGITVDGSSRAFNADVWADWWQGQNQLWENIRIYDLFGSAFMMTGCRKATIRNCYITNSGSWERGAPVIGWFIGTEGGGANRKPEYGLLDNVTIQDSGDWAVYWLRTMQCGMKNCSFDGMTADVDRELFLMIDAEFSTVQGNTFQGANRDCVRIQSRGIGVTGPDGEFSHENVITGNVAIGENAGAGGGGFYGIREFAPYTDVSHAGNVIENNVGVVQIDSP